jgi:hypothetical protein
MRQKSSILEMITLEQSLISLHANGKCSIYYSNGDIYFLNSTEDQLIRSIFYNSFNGSIVIVYVCSKDDYSSLKCASIKISDMKSEEKPS